MEYKALCGVILTCYFNAFILSVYLTTAYTRRTTCRASWAPKGCLHEKGLTDSYM